MQKGEIDKTLAQMFEGETLFAPDLANVLEPSKPRSTSTAFATVNLPTKEHMYQGYQLLHGSLSLESVAPDNAVIILTADSTLIHIDPYGLVTSNQGNKRVPLGYVAYDIPTLPLEREKPFALPLYNPQTERVSLFSPGTPIIDMVMYYPHPVARTRENHTRRHGSVNLYSPHLYRFMK